MIIHTISITVAGYIF